MTAEAPGPARKKHRHDLGEEDHGPVLAAGPTRAIQALLFLWIVLTVALVVYTLIEVSRPRSAPMLPRTDPHSADTPAAPRSATPPDMVRRAPPSASLAR